MARDDMFLSGGAGEQIGKPTGEKTYRLAPLLLLQINLLYYLFFMTKNQHMGNTTEISMES